MIGLLLISQFGSWGFCLTFLSREFGSYIKFSIQIMILDISIYREEKNIGYDEIRKANMIKPIKTQWNSVSQSVAKI